MPKQRDIDHHETILEEVFRHTPVGVALIDLHGTIFDTNPALGRLLGVESSTLNGTNFGALVDHDQAADFDDLLTWLREGRIETTALSVRLLDSLDNRLTVNLNLSVVESTDVEPAWCIAFVEDIEQRVRVESKLRDTEDRYKRIVEDQTDLISRSTPDGTLLFVNDAYCRHYQVRREDILGTSFFEFVKESNRETVRRKLALLTPEQPVASGMQEVLEPDGQIGWQRWIDRGFFDDEGNLVELQSVGRDVTEEREANERVRLSEERLRLLYDNMPLPVWESDWTKVVATLKSAGLTDPNKLPSRASETVEIFRLIEPDIQIRSANPVALQLCEVDTLEEFVRWVPQAYTPDSMRRFLVAAADLLFRGVRMITVPVTIISARGRKTEGLVRTARLSDDPDDWRMIVCVQDLTDVARIGRELRERQEMMTRVESAAHAGSWEWDPSTDTLRGSNEFWRILDGRPGGAAERNLRDSFSSIHPDDLPKLERLVDRTSDPDSPLPASREYDLRLVRPDGSTAVVTTQAFFWYGDRGVVERAFGTLQDVTERKRAEIAAERHRDEMIRADKMISLGILVSGVAHEINNPNHSIRLNLPLLRNAWSDATRLLDEIVSSENRDVRLAGAPWNAMRDEIPDVINDIEQACERIRTIVAELKGFATDRERGVTTPTAINEIVESSMRLLANIVRKSTNNLRLELAEDLPLVNVAAQRIEQVIVNLVVNACQALESPDKGVTIRTSTRDHYVLVSVCDEGTGIATEDMKKILDPFFTTKRNRGGTGLGLSVSQRIVEDHGGRLEFESVPGSGTTAVLSIPIESSEVPHE